MNVQNQNIQEFNTTAREIDQFEALDLQKIDDLKTIESFDNEFEWEAEYRVYLADQH